MKLIIIDAGVWVRLARSSFAKPITDRIVEFGILPVMNNYLLSEVHEALIKNNWATQRQADTFVAYIKSLGLFVTEHSVYRLSPDPKDNYLIDLAVQHNCAFIITDDAKLLSLPLLPIPVKSCNWFLKRFPV
jgi:putative PIN family toxin of toxin-antitoxin system